MMDLRRATVMSVTDITVALMSVTVNIVAGIGR